MIAKLITYGATRNEAIDLMKQALADYRVVGLNNNLKFLKRVISDPIFRAGTYDTSYIEKNIDSLLNKDKVIDPFEVVSAVIARTYSKSKSITLPR